MRKPDFGDGGHITLKPNSTVQLERFRFVQDKPGEDAFVLRVVKGGLRAVTGGVGKRSKDNYQMETETATVGIRGTTFAVDDCVSTRDGECARLAPAVYVGVADGEVVVRKGRGVLGLGVGQFGHMLATSSPCSSPPIRGCSSRHRRPSSSSSSRAGRLPASARSWSARSARAALRLFPLR